MKRFKIIHETRYDFRGQVNFYPHIFRLRPREGHELHIESSRLDVFPSATLRWHRDAEGNSIAIATFDEASNNLTIKSEIIIQKFDLNPLDFLISEYALNYPFSYQEEDKICLIPYLINQEYISAELKYWAEKIWKPHEKIQIFSVLDRLNQRIFKTFNYLRREEEGVQSPEYTIANGSGSCRDFANLFMATAQYLGFAARFVSGYVYSGVNSIQPGSTHAWAEVFIPGAGWKGFDPTSGTIAGATHIATAVSRRPELVPPISGSYFGNADSSMSVEVWVTEAA